MQTTSTITEEIKRLQRDLEVNREQGEVVQRMRYRDELSFNDPDLLGLVRALVFKVEDIKKRIAGLYNELAEQTITPTQQATSGGLREEYFATFKAYRNERATWGKCGYKLQNKLTRMSRKYYTAEQKAAEELNTFPMEND